MGGAEGVVFAFGALGEARQPAAATKRADTVAPAGQDLVRIGLMADIPDQAIFRGIENVMQRDRELDHPQPAPRWPPVTATASIVSWRSSSASWRNWPLSSRRRSAGVLTRSRRGVLEG